MGDRHVSRLLQRQKRCRLPGMKDKTAQTQRLFCYKGPGHMLRGARTAPKFKVSRTGREETAAWMRDSRVSPVGMMQVLHLKWTDVSVYPAWLREGLGSPTFCCSCKHM